MKTLGVFGSYVRGEQTRKSGILKHLPESLRLKYKELKWREINGMRDELTMAQFRLDPEFTRQFEKSIA